MFASELKDPICHSDECQIGSFSSEATNILSKSLFICLGVNPVSHPVDENMCEDQNPCHNGGVCLNLGSHYRCICTGYFTGDHCGKLQVIQAIKVVNIILFDELFKCHYIIILYYSNFNVIFLLKKISTGKVVKENFIFNSHEFFTQLSYPVFK